ncbi:hypothetical protein LLH06_11440 [Mucilaginibacter daejeonensis]|uniref:hypothetical protein n=1 Tax=Mucilaginibacter daejeonensis TaxID=398049 RepID=UPI001D176B8A|nr:hypothetical protein [Mucilaginibacter daejeonensis]UEG51585.1 hypothetical protein LLH06_11440 [Mucilaginibacter daejeonensis]
MDAGVKAPAGVKVDGKLTEWGTLPVHSRATNLHYTLANDATKLYLAISCDDQPTISKLLNGGLTFTINRDGKKKEKDAAMIEYPLGGRGGMRGFRGRNGATDTAAMVAGYKQTVAGAKELSVLGVKEVTDTLVSIYNTYGIKVSIGFDAHGTLSYELALPLDLLELNADKATEIAYNIKLNGIQFGRRNRGEGGRQGGDARQGGGDGNGGGFGLSGGFGGQMGDMTTPTDVWGKYTLAKP